MTTDTKNPYHKPPGDGLQSPRNYPHRGATNISPYVPTPYIPPSNTPPHSNPYPNSHSSVPNVPPNVHPNVPTPMNVTLPNNVPSEPNEVNI